MVARKLVLASTSPFRRVLLERLGIPFATANPSVDETPLPAEEPVLLVQRLAEAKARAVAHAHRRALIIGSDQLATLDGAVMGKPGGRAGAITQLEMASGRTVSFLTGLCLLNADSGHAQVACEPFRVHFRTLTPEQIAFYVDQEQPFSCAGSFKSEGLGIALFERLEGDDPNALIGLPLIRLIRMLATEGIDVLSRIPGDGDTERLTGDLP
jgi:septum formation protein